ncbi:Solute carrier 26, partial [Blyttiomyces sp. JEL0837]
MVSNRNGNGKKKKAGKKKNNMLLQRRDALLWATRAEDAVVQELTTEAIQVQKQTTARQNILDVESGPDDDVNAEQVESLEQDQMQGLKRHGLAKFLHSFKNPLVDTDPDSHDGEPTPMEAFARKTFPIIDQMKGYTTKMFLDDLISGVSIAFVLLPQSIAYSSLAQLQPIQALVTAVFPTFIYFIFGASRQLSIGPEAIVSVIVGTAILREVESFPDTGYTPSQIAGCMAFVAAIMSLGIAMLRGGFIDNILSGYLLTGFIAGVSNLIIAEQMPELFGLTVKLPGEASTLDKLITAFKAFNTIRWIPSLISVSNVAFLLGIRRIKKWYGGKYPWLKRIPEILVVVVVMILVSWSADLQSKGIHVLGKFNNQLETPHLPLFDRALMGRLVQPALTALLVGYIECQTTTRNFGLKNGYFPNANQELFTFGLMNIVSSVLGGYTVYGSLTRSRILANAGANTTIANLISAIVVLISLLGLVVVLQFLPRATLASIVFVAALGLIEVKEIAFVFQCRSWSEIFMFLTTFLITVLTSISDGILICLGLSALLIIRRTTATSLSVLGRIKAIVPSSTSSSTTTSNINPNDTTTNNNSSSSSSTATFDFTNETLNNNNNMDTIATTTTTQTTYYYVDLEEHPEAELLDGVILLRFNEPLLFYNSGMTRRAIEAMMLAERKIIRSKLSMGIRKVGNGNGGGPGASGAVARVLGGDGIRGKTATNVNTNASLNGEGNNSNTIQHGHHFHFFDRDRRAIFDKNTIG